MIQYRDHTHGGNIDDYPKPLLDFSANINPLGMPCSVEQAAIDEVKKCVHYPQPFSLLLSRQIARNETINLAAGEISAIQPRQVICGNGAAELLYLTCHALQPAGGVSFAPVFAEYRLALQAAGAAHHEVLLKEEEGFALTRASVLEAVKILRDQRTNKPGIIFLCIPNNPTGVMPSPEVFDLLLSKCREYGIWLALDACFADLCAEQEMQAGHQMIMQALDFEKGIVFRAFTKSFAMPGIRLGYVITRSNDLQSAVWKQLQPWNVSRIAQAAGIAAAAELGTGTFLEESRSYLDTEKNFLLTGLEKLREKGFVDRVYGHAANFILFRTDTHRGRADLDLSSAVYDRGILIRDCRNFSGLEAGYYRIAVRTHEENCRLMEALTWLSGS